VGWSDGAILGIESRHASQGASGQRSSPSQQIRWTSGVKDGVDKHPTFAAYIERAGREYAAHSATPKDYDSFVDQISKMWAEQPKLE